MVSPKRNKTSFRFEEGSCFRMLKHIHIALFVILSFGTECYAFQTENDTIPSANVPGMPLPKGLEINHRYFTGTSINAIPVFNEFVADRAKLEQVTFFQFKLKIPLVIKPTANFLIGFDYNERKYHFSQSETLESSLFQEMNQEQLRSREISLYYSKALDKKHFISVKTDFALNGDLRRIDDFGVTNFVRYSAAVIYGWKPHQNLAHGIGLYLNYSLGRPSIYPVFLWNKKINERWGIEAKVPANIQFRRDFGKNSRLYMGYTLDGNTYVLDSQIEPLSQFETAELRRSDIIFQVRYEKEIYDFIWFEIGAGYSFNFRLKVSEENSFNDEKLLRNELDPSFVFRGSLFVVPTEGLKKIFGF